MQFVPVIEAVKVIVVLMLLLAEDGFIEVIARFVIGGPNVGVGVGVAVGGPVVGEGVEVGRPVVGVEDVT